MFKYDIGDSYKLGIIDDVITERDCICGVNVYTFKTITGQEITASEAELDMWRSRGQIIRIKDLKIKLIEELLAS